MKYSVTLTEMANIFSSLSKAEAKINAYFESYETYEALEWEDNSMEAIDHRLSVMEKAEKAEKATIKALKNCFAALELDENNWEDNEIIKRVTWRSQFRLVLALCQERAIKVSTYLR